MIKWFLQKVAANRDWNVGVFGGERSVGPVRLLQTEKWRCFEDRI
jgi:hypothetical protein